ncbi:MAG TPA: Tn3 family transposase [Stenomitos sp.]
MPYLSDQCHRVFWNTVYIQAALDYLTQEGCEANPEDTSHLSSYRFEHINPYGKMRFDIAQIFLLKRVTVFKTSQKCSKMSLETYTP